MKIVFINKNLALGGGERLIVSLAKEFQRNNQTFDIILFENKVDFDNLETLNIFPLIRLKTVPKILRPFFFPLFLFKLLLICRKYDLILSFERYPAYFNSLISYFVKTKSIIYVQTPLAASLNEIYKNDFLKVLHLFAHRLVFSSADLAVAVGKGVQQELIKQFHPPGNKTATIEPFVDVNQVDKLVKKPLSSSDKNLFREKKVVISVGRLDSVKNHRLLIRAFKEVTNKIEEVILIIIGEGRERKHLYTLRKKINLEDKVFLLGPKKNPYKYLSQSDLFVLSSKHEGFPNALLEALYCNLPIISFDCPYGPREILTPELSLKRKLNKVYWGKYGVLVPRNTKETENLSKTIIRLLENKSIAEKYKWGRARAMDFTIKKTYNKWIKILSHS